MDSHTPQQRGTIRKYVELIVASWNVRVTVGTFIMSVSLSWEGERGSREREERGEGERERERDRQTRERDHSTAAWLMANPESIVNGRGWCSQLLPRPLNF